jgi:3-dehydroquinate synthetase
LSGRRIIEIRFPLERTTVVEFSGIAALGDLESPSPSYLVLDSEVARLHGDRIGSALRGEVAGVSVVSASESMKTFRLVRDLVSDLSGAGIRRESWVIAAGGGMVCDAAAFAASIWLRGTRLALVPTTLLAQVDACLGGKTGVNLGRAKNQIGTFHPADRIIVDPGFVETLPRREIRSGLGEVLKTAVISGHQGLMRLLGRLPAGPGLCRWVRDVSAICLETKAGIVSADPLEAGPRRVLNLGHTLGHALESAGRFSLSHGECVALGCLTSAAMAAGLGGDAGLHGQIAGLCGRLGLPRHIPGGISAAAVRRFLDADKKTGGRGRTWILPFAWGDCRQVLLDPGEEKHLLGSALDSVTE